MTQVMKVKCKDTGEIFALKVMDKKHIIRENKVNLVKMERMILDQLDFPGIIRLCFTFQDSYSLCIFAGTKIHLPIAWIFLSLQCQSSVECKFWWL